MWYGQKIFSKLRNHFCNSPFLGLPSPQSGASGKKNLSSLYFYRNSVTDVFTSGESE